MVSITFIGVQNRIKISKLKKKKKIDLTGCCIIKVTQHSSDKTKFQILPYLCTLLFTWWFATVWWFIETIACVLVALSFLEYWKAFSVTQDNTEIWISCLSKSKSFSVLSWGLPRLVVSGVEERTHMMIPWTGGSRRRTAMYFYSSQISGQRSWANVWGQEG